MIKPIRSEKDYDNALTRIDELMDLHPKKGTKAYDEMEVLVTLVSDYEDKNHPIPPPHPLEAIKYRQEEIGMSDSQLARLLGTRSRKSEIFSGKRKLNLRQIRRLHKRMNIPAEILIKDY